MSHKLEFQFGPEFQVQMLSFMLKDAVFAARVCKHIPAERLYSDSYKYFYNLIRTKLSKGELLTMVEVEDELKKIERTRRKVLHHFATKVFQTKVESTTFLQDKLTEYAKRNHFMEVFVTAQTLYNSKKFDESYACTTQGMNDLFSINFKDDAVIPIESFEELRLLSSLDAGMARVPTNIDRLDELLRGGLEKGELGIILAEPKKGKSIGLTHMGAAAVMMGTGRVAHFVLEGTTKQAILRYQSRLSGIPYHRLEKDDISAEEQKLLDHISKRYMHRLDLIPFNQHWNYTVQHVESSLKELTNAGKKPDLVVIDYADLLKSAKSYEAHRHEQTEVYRDLKRLAVIGKFAIWTASQATRPKESPDTVYLLRAKDIAESYEKVRIADLLVTLNQTPDEKSLGILRLHVDIYRSNAADFSIKLLVDFERMIFFSKKYGHAGDLDDHAWMHKRSKRGTS